jgi:putative transposase
VARPIRIEYPGAVYHVITRGNNRQAIFRDDTDRKNYLERLASYCEQKEVHLLCYCLLTNHVHLLLETPKGNLSKMMQPFQTSYTVYFNRRHGRSGHVFEQRYKAFLVDKDNYLLQVSRYIHLNPVGAGIVRRPQEYRWSSYRAYVGEGMSLGLNKEIVLGQFGAGGKGGVLRYREFVEGAAKRNEEWENLPVIQQAFVGEEGFVRQARRRVAKDADQKEKYGIREITRAVVKVMGLEEDELRRPLRREEIQRGREILMYLGRRYGEASLREMVDLLGVKERSTVSHGVKRAELRLKQDRGFSRQVHQVLTVLSRSPMQA